MFEEKLEVHLRNIENTFRMLGISNRKLDESIVIDGVEVHIMIDSDANIIGLSNGQLEEFTVSSDKFWYQINSSMKIDRLKMYTPCRLGISDGASINTLEIFGNRPVAFITASNIHKVVINIRESDYEDGRVLINDFVRKIVNWADESIECNISFKYLKKYREYLSDKHISPKYAKAYRNIAKLISGEYNIYFDSIRSLEITESGLGVRGTIVRYKEIKWKNLTDNVMASLKRLLKAFFIYQISGYVPVRNVDIKVNITD